LYFALMMSIRGEFASREVRALIAALAWAGAAAVMLWIIKSTRARGRDPARQQT
jgi:hypothetical protein